MILKNNIIPYQKNLWGLNKYLLDLCKLVDKDKLPKVLMLSGKKGQGKFTLVYHLLSYIFDKKNYDLESSLIKNENKILNKIEDNNISNIIYFDCINKSIKIEDIRKLRIDLQKSSLDNLNRFIIFDDIESLNENCVNALLKTIEEPSETNYFILINNKSRTILNTLKSRALEIMIFLNKENQIEIIKNIISDLCIEEVIDSTNTTLTPGNYLRYNKIVLDDKINIDDNLITNIKKLLKLNKLKKNIDYQNLAIYLINQYYFYKSNSFNINNFNEKRIKIIRKIQESNKLNLNNNNLITEIEHFI